MRLDVFLRGYFLLFFVGIFCIAAHIGLMFGSIEKLMQAITTLRRDLKRY